MGRLIVSTQMTTDAVIDSPEGWFVPEGEHEDGAREQLGLADALLLGRKTYEGLSAIWPRFSDEHGFADRMNSLPKYVASRTLNEPLAWNASLIKGDVGERVLQLKRELRGDLVMYGCGELAGQLAHEGLVDEVRLWIHPTAWGDGTRIFGATRPIRLELLATTTFRSGIVLLRYRPTARSEPVT